MGKLKVWIDLDNSPHVPFFAPIIAELTLRGYGVWVTARDRGQIGELAAMHHIPHTLIGREYGKCKFLKIPGLLYRAFQLLPLARQERPQIAVSHGSRSQVMAAKVLGMTTVVMLDYEYVDLSFPFISIDHIFMPDAIPEGAITARHNHIWRYSGIKEDVYVPEFRPTEDVLRRLGIGPDKIVVTMRPPATTAHYHNVKSESLFRDVIALTAETPDTVIIMLPRNEEQGKEIRRNWRGVLETGNMIIPEKAVNGLDLTWESDLVVSGGGTMIREAAALGVPAYSVFSGETGCVDRHLAQTGRLKIIANSADIGASIVFEKRLRRRDASRSEETLKSIVNQLEKVMKGQP